MKKRCREATQMIQPYLEAGKIVSTHGIKGEVKVLPWADSPDFLTRFKTFYLVGSDAHIAPVIAAGNDAAAARRQEASGDASLRSTALAVEASRVQKSCVLIKFRGIDTVEDAQKLRDKVISIARDDPKIPAGTVFQADLIGMPVFADGAEIGKITEILSMPSSDVWVVRGEREYMIPNVKAFVPAIDLSLGYVNVNLIEGMETDGE
jgi:16S rRNA processing protein RimM